MCGFELLKTSWNSYVFEIMRSKQPSLVVVRDHRWPASPGRYVGKPLRFSVALPFNESEDIKFIFL